MSEKNTDHGSEVQSTHDSEEQSAHHSEQQSALRVYVIDVISPDVCADDAAARLSELESLVTTYKGVVIVKALQKKAVPDYRTYVGKGKLEELREEMKADKATLLVIGNIMKPAQVYTVAELFRKDGIQVWDRVDLILKIFERHATSTEARLQIELAAIHHMGPRIFGMGMELSRQGGGTGGSGGRAGRGIGETNTERMKRHLQEKKLTVMRELEKYKKVRGLHRTARRRKDMFTVGIVGYTNAGKSHLMHAMTGKNILVEDKLFATLGTAVGEMKPPRDFAQDAVYPYGKILVNDTIGFIRDLPPELIQAFTSTLEDSVYADILLHVIDASDPRIAEKIAIVDTILDTIDAKQEKIYVYNKIDCIGPEQILTLKKTYADQQPFFLSALTGEGIDALKERLLVAREGE